MRVCGGVKVNVAPRSGHLIQRKKSIVDSGLEAGLAREVSL